MDKYFKHRNSNDEIRNLMRYKKKTYKELIMNINYDRLSRGKGNDKEW